MTGDYLRVTCKRLVCVVFGPVCKGVKVVTPAQPAVSRVLVLRALVDECAVGVAKNLLADDIHTVHSVVVRRVRDGEQGVLVELNDQRSQLALSSSSVLLLSLGSLGTTAYEAMELVEGSDEVDALGGVFEGSSRWNQVHVLDLAVTQRDDAITHYETISLGAHGGDATPGIMLHVRHTRKETSPELSSDGQVMVQEVVVVIPVCTNHLAGIGSPGRALDCV